MPTIKNRRASKSQWAARNSVLATGEMGVEIDTNKFKIGNGVSAWNDLPYFVDETAINNKSSLTVNMEDVVGFNDGVTDQGPALLTAIASLPVKPNAFGAVGTVYFPAGNWVISGSFSNSEAKRFNIVGEGAMVTTIKRPSGQDNTDLFTLNAKHTFISGVTIEGGRYQGNTGDSVVLNGAYTRFERSVITKSGGNGLTIGKAGAAIVHTLHSLLFRENAKYGIHTVASSGSTDGMWSDVEVGNSGLSGVRLSTGAQNISNLHVWGSGLESTADRDGIWLESGSNQLTNWQSEKNLGRGVRITSDSNVLTGGRAWGNCLGAVYLLSANYNMVANNIFCRNSVNNTSGSTSTSFAVVFLDGASTRNSFGNNNFWDTATEMPAGTYVTQPTYPYPGRTAVRTHALLYAEAGTSDYNVLVANDVPRELTRLGSSVLPYVIVGNNDLIENNNWGSTIVPDRSVVSGAVRVPADSNVITVSASTEITSVLGHRRGREITIIFTAATPGVVRDNGTTLNLAGDFTPSKGGTLQLVSDGTNWYETGRSTN
ncbi:tail fiber protein [Rhodococcus phage ReqiPepy6]|uniref:Tail fiber protein n=1 Tax=Rhodococcus phage ReqiPepy6 TaxID=691965 RepID=D4P7B2_9CAUD|nr:tail fiber protein [Rhodococcus phage ReqiPepy6]ADD80892.1 tail fiber protein [Rhodococcus phage ReqiPepy6]